LASNGSSNDRLGQSVSFGDGKIYSGAFGFNNLRGKVYQFDLNANLFYSDSDSDGYGNPNASVSACFQPEGYVSNNLDCNDNNPLINPLTQEVCDGIDNNCDGLFDEGNICCDNGLLTNNYIGNSLNWFNANNWSLGTVPTICDRVIIPNGKTVRVLDGESAFCFSIDVASGGFLDVQDGAKFQAVAPNN